MEEEAKAVEYGRFRQVARDLETQARHDQVMVKDLAMRMPGGVVDQDLLSEYEQDMETLKTLNQTLTDFEAMDKALEARQWAVQAKLERLRHVMDGDRKTTRRNAASVSTTSVPQSL